MPPVPLLLQISSPINVALGGNSFYRWTEREGDGQPNFLAIMILAWSYILSARLVELQGGNDSLLRYTEAVAPLHQGDEKVANVSIDVSGVDSRTMRWFAAILASGVGFQAILDRKDTYNCHSPWAYSLGVNTSSFSIECREGHEGFKLSDNTPLSSYQALQSLFEFDNRYGVSSYQLHAALATALLLPTLKRLQVNTALPSPAVGNQKFPSAKLRPENLDQLYYDLPYYITLSCEGDIINSSLCGVFWNPYIFSNLASPWLQPLLDLSKAQSYQYTPDRYNEILAVISVRRAPNLAYLSVNAAISGLTSKILKQVLTGQPPLEQHAFAWIEVPQSFMDLAEEGEYYETRGSKAYIRRSNCWRLRKLPPIVDDDLHYEIGPFTPWAPPGYALLKNCPLRVQIHKYCDRHTLAYKNSTWYFSNKLVLENDLKKNKITPHIFRDALLEESGVSHGLQNLDHENTSIEATRALF